MARSKVNLRYIRNNTARKVTYKKRSKGLLKKTQEISVLCGVDACAVVYSPYSETPLIWPSSESEVRRIVLEYKQKSHIDQSQRIFNQEAFLRQSATKAREKILRLQRRNRELDMENTLGDLYSGTPVQQVSLGDVKDLFWVIEDRLRTVEHRIRVVEGGGNVNGQVQMHSAPSSNVS
ncbi:hypothetical protein vseg_017342 [Gypsophila vaccaria]